MILFDEREFFEPMFTGEESLLSKLYSVFPQYASFKGKMNVLQNKIEVIPYPDETLEDIGYVLDSMNVLKKQERYCMKQIYSTYGTLLLGQHNRYSISEEEFELEDTLLSHLKRFSFLRSEISVFDYYIDFDYEQVKLESEREYLAETLRDISYDFYDGISILNEKLEMISMNIPPFFLDLEEKCKRCDAFIQDMGHKGKFE